MRTTTLLALATAALGACQWTDFDDLQNQTWVGSTQKPSVNSSDYGVAIQRGAQAGDGGTLVVIGASQAIYSELVYTAQGDAELAASTLDLRAQYAIDKLDAQPILLADPTSDDVALIVNAGGAQILALVGAGQLEQHDLVVSPSTVDAASYVQPPPRPDTAAPQPARPLVASGEVVVGAFVNPQPSSRPTCKLIDSVATPTAINARALGAARNAMGFDDVLAWGSNGKLYRYPASVFNGCAVSGAPPLASHDTGFSPGHGSQILAIDATHVLLQGHHDTEDASLLQVYDTSSLMPVGDPVSTGGVRTAAILDAGAAGQFVVAGYPATIVGKQPAGQVLLFRVSAMGLTTSPAATLNDAQPENNQAFGRAVAVMPFNGTPVVAVAANNEIFVYYRLALTDGTPLYAETRQGR